MRPKHVSYCPQRDCWSDQSGRLYIRNEHNQNNIVWIEAHSQKWSTISDGRTCSIDWNSFKLPETILEVYRQYVITSLKLRSPAYITACKVMLDKLSRCWNPSWNDYQNLGIKDYSDIWSKLDTKSRSVFRKSYSYFVSECIAGANYLVSKEIRLWHSRKTEYRLKKVLMWDSKQGALISKEVDVLKQTLENFKSRSVKETAIILSVWIALETVKRSVQILSAKADAVKRVGPPASREFYLSLPPRKAQTGQSDRWWNISESLANAIIRFQTLEGVALLQNRFDRLIIWNTKNIDRDKQISTLAMSGAIQNYFSRSNPIVSPRTNKNMHISMLRLRHTGATQLALNGVSRDVIQEVLEHTSFESAQAYIDATASDLLRKIEQVNQRMGDVFGHLDKIYFKGKVNKEIGDIPIHIPERDQRKRLLIGSCSKSACDMHPFFSCYSGCASFLAWREQDHRKALRFIESELERLRSISLDQKHRQIIEQYESVEKGILDVIRQIEEGEND